MTAEALPLVPLTATVAETMRSVDLHGAGIALVVDAESRLVGTVTDGDARRAVLVGVDLQAPVGALLERRDIVPNASPTTAPLGTPDAKLIQLMTERSLRHIPLVDEAGVPRALATLAELVLEHELPIEAVVMAGGYGRRLAPLTSDTPKPMLPLGDRPLLERIVAQLREAGIQRVNITTHYRANEIIDHFRDGTDFGVDIHYVQEEEPLGTAGALALMEEASGPLLVMNGDLVTNVDFRAMLHFHEDHDAAMTVAVRRYEVKLPFGLVRLAGERLVGVEEKPAVGGFINAGIYLLDPSVRQHVPVGSRFDMTDLVERLVAHGSRVVGFPLREYWLDIGRAEDYEQALLDHAEP